MEHIAVVIDKCMYVVYFKQYHYLMKISPKYCDSFDIDIHFVFFPNILSYVNSSLTLGTANAQPFPLCSAAYQKDTPRNKNCAN